MTQRRILVTGAAGRLGGAVISRLADGPDVEVIRVVSSRSAGTPNSVVALDLADQTAAARLIDETRPDSVIHLAAINGVECEIDPRRTHAVNVEATRALADASARTGVRRFIFASSAAVYGSDYHRPIREDDALLGASRYARSKVAAETALAESAGAMSTVALRVFNLYGPAFDHSLITRLQNSRKEEPVVLRGLDGFVRDYVHVVDVVQAVTASLDLDLPRGHSTFNIGSGHMLSNREVVETLKRDHALHFVVGDEQPSWSGADISRARQTLNYHPDRTVGDVDATL